MACGDRLWSLSRSDGLGARGDERMNPRSWTCPICTESDVLPTRRRFYNYKDVNNILIQVYISVKSKMFWLKVQQFEETYVDWSESDWWGDTSGGVGGGVSCGPLRISTLSFWTLLGEGSRELGSTWAPSSGAVSSSSEHSRR